jgi:hypothetical protein
MVPGVGYAGTIALGFCPSTPDTGRCATLTDAVSGTTGTANATVAEVNAAFGPAWTEVGEATNNDTNGSGPLTIAVTEGTFGGKKVSGTWSISSLFTYTDLAISMHVGNAQATPPTEPDHFIWLVVMNGPGAPYSGTWTFDGEDIAGSSLSNIKAYGRNSVLVPEGGTTLGLLVMGMLCLVTVRRLNG